MVLNPSLLGILTPIEKFLSLNLYHEPGYFVCLVFVLCFSVDGNWQTHSWSSYREKEIMEGSPLNVTCICIKSLLSGDLGPLLREEAERLEEPEPVDYYSHMMCSHLTGQLHILPNWQQLWLHASSSQTKIQAWKGEVFRKPRPWVSIDSWWLLGEEVSVFFRERLFLRQWMGLHPCTHCSIKETLQVKHGRKQMEMEREKWWRG